MDYNFSVREYDKYMQRKYADALRKGETQAESVLDYWVELKDTNNKTKE